VPIAPPPAALVNQFADVYRWLLPRLNFMAQSFPSATPTSWYRSPARNFAVGGDPRSQHQLAWAADWAGLDAGGRDRFCHTGRAIGLVCVDEGDHVHVQTFPRFTIPDQFFNRRIPV